MRLLNPWRLAEALGAGSLSETDKFRVLLAGMVVSGLLGTNLGLLYSVGDRRLTLTALGRLALGLVALGAAFVRNQRGDGRAFVERFVCLGAVLLIWLSAGYLLAYYVLLAALTAVRGGWSSAFAAAFRDGFWRANLVLAVLYAAVLWYFVGRAAGHGSPLDARPAE